MLVANPVLVAHNNFAHYREGPLESILDDNFELGLDSIAVEEIEVEKQPQQVTTSPTPVMQQPKQDLYAKEMELLTLMSKKLEQEAPFDYTMENIIETACAKCEWLIEADDMIQMDVMDETNRILKKNLLYEMMAQDKRSAKILALHDRLNEVYLKGAVVSPQQKRHIEGLISATHLVAQNPREDDFFKECSKPRKRGRAKISAQPKKPHVVDALRGEYISSKKAVNIFSELIGDEVNGMPVDTPIPEEEVDPYELTDKYKVFLHVLQQMHENLASQQNYGAYIKDVVALTEKEGIDWPLQKLFGCILNMEALIGCQLVEDIQFNEGEQVYYCSYTGDRIEAGDDVYLIRLLEPCPVRHRMWRIHKSLPEREFEAPEFTKSVRAFFIKKTVITPTGLFCRRHFDNDAAYLKRYESFFDDSKRPKKKEKREPTTTMKPAQASTSSPLIVARHSRLWTKIDDMRRLLYTHGLERREVKGKRFDDELRRINTLLNTHTDMDICLRSMIDPYYYGDDDDDDARNAFLEDMAFMLAQFMRHLFVAPLPSTFLMADIERCECEGNKVALHQLLVRSGVKTIDEDRISASEEFRECKFLFMALFSHFFPYKEIEEALELFDML